MPGAPTHRLTVSLSLESLAQPGIVCLCACIGKDTVVKFVRLCFVCDLYSVPARIQPRPCRPVVYSFVQRHLQASELSYKPTVQYH